LEEEVDDQLQGDSSDRGGDEDEGMFLKLFSSRLASICLLETTGLGGLSTEQDSSWVRFHNCR